MLIRAPSSNYPDASLIHLLRRYEIADYCFLLISTMTSKAATSPRGNFRGRALGQREDEHCDVADTTSYCKNHSFAHVDSM